MHKPEGAEPREPRCGFLQTAVTEECDNQLPVASCRLSDKTQVATQQRGANPSTCLGRALGHPVDPRLTAPP
jgi:hypothetical protein